MSGATRARAVLLTLAFLLHWTGAARAAQPEEEGESPPFQLAYDAPEACPSALAFFGAIRSRTERARLARPGELAVSIAVRITALRGGSVVGRVDIREPDGVRQERTVESATCKEVAQALALVVALYLDPDATTATESPPPPPTPEPPPRRVEPKDVAPSPPSPSPPPAAAPAIAIGAGAGAGVAAGIGPSVAPLVRALGEMTIEGRAIARAMSWARPSARLSIDVATTSADVTAGSQRYVLVAGSLRLCPVDVAVGRGVHAGPCAALQAGVLRGTSEGVPNARDQRRAWVSPLATVHTSLVVAERLSVELEVGLALPLVRTRYFLGPNVTVHRTPAVAGTLSAAVTYRFR